MNSDKPLDTTAISFLANFYLKQGITRSMLWLISFLRAYSSCKEREARIE